MIKTIDCYKLVAHLASKPERIFPQDVRRLCMGMVPDTNPSFVAIGNHRHHYPTVHYRPVVKNRIEILGIGEEGALAIGDIRDAFLAKGRIFENSAAIEILGVQTEKYERRVGLRKGLSAYDILSPLHVFHDYAAFATRDERDVIGDYCKRISDNIEWIFRRLGVPLDGSARVLLEGAQEATKKVLREKVGRPALVRGTLVTNCYLPPAIGQGVGLGWGMIKPVSLSYS